jgi:hypothetical protein
MHYNAVSCILQAYEMAHVSGRRGRRALRTAKLVDLPRAQLVQHTVTGSAGSTSPMGWNPCASLS